MSKLDAINHVASLIRDPVLPSATKARPGAFEAVLTDAIHRVEQFRSHANQQVDSFLAGENEDVHQVALATQRAELAFETFVQVRNKVVQAYQEVMRMQM